MFLVLCKLVQSREVASLGTIAFSESARFSKGKHMQLMHAAWKALGSLWRRSGGMSLGSSAKSLLVHCGKTDSTEIHLVLLFGLSAIHIWFPGDATSHRHPGSRFMAGSVEGIFRTSLPHSGFNLDDEQGFLLISCVMLIDIFRIFTVELSFFAPKPPQGRSLFFLL